MIFHLYRFRPVDAGLDKYEELAKQEIYFASPEKLNDPMEGYKDVFWSGDLIVWRYLFRHYLLCLLQTTYLCYVMGAKFDSADLKTIVFSPPEKLSRRVSTDDLLKDEHFARTRTFRNFSKRYRPAQLPCGAMNSPIISARFTPSP